jgi:protease-4
MTQSLPPGQGPVDPRGALGMPPAPGGSSPQRPAWPPAGPPGGFFPMMPPPPPPHRGGIARTLFIILLVIALIFSVMLNFAQLGNALGEGSIKETVIVAGDSSSKIAVVPIDGLILDQSAETLDQVLTYIEKDSAVKALVLEINTPGGSASASDEMYHRVLRFKQNEKSAGRNVPVVVAMRGMATSGGYYVSCAADYLIAEPICLTGNIGVLLPAFNLSKLVGNYGIEETTLTATTTGHSYKNAGSMFKPVNPQDEAYLQGIVDGLFAQFKAAVQTGRAGKLNDATGDIFSGKAFIAQEAKDRGLIDQIDYPETAYDYAAKLAAVTSKEVVRYTPRTSLLDMFDNQSTLPPAKAVGNVSFTGVTVDSQSLIDLICARPMMLWRAN